MKVAKVSQISSKVLLVTPRLYTLLLSGEASAHHLSQKLEHFEGLVDNTGNVYWVGILRHHQARFPRSACLADCSVSGLCFLSGISV